MINPIFPLTVFAHCPKCGSTDCSSPDIKRFVCAACGFEYFQNAAAAVIAVIRDPGNRVLFVRRARDPGLGKLDLPGGFVDPLETAEQALIREVHEETGLEITELTFLATFTNRYEYRSVTYYTLDLVFLCRVADRDTLRPLDEVTEVLFLPPESVSSDDIAFESVRKAIKAVTSGCGVDG